MGRSDLTRYNDLRQDDDATGRRMVDDPDRRNLTPVDVPAGIEEFN